MKTIVQLAEEIGLIKQPSEEAQGFYYGFSSDIESLCKAYMADRLSGIEPFAWYVYVEQASKGYLIDDLDDTQAVDDATNHDAVITPLYDLTK